MPRKSKYPWDKWLSRMRSFKLCRGVDYDCQPYGMANQIRNAASKRGVSISVSIDEDVLTVRLRPRGRKTNR